MNDSNELLGRTLGTCTLQRLIGRGGMGAVYLARQSRPRRTVAIKVLMPSMVQDARSREEFLTRFRREADAIAALDHVNILPVYEYGEQGMVAYLVMPYLNGGTLRDVLDHRGILPMAETVSIIEQAAAALDCAHAQNIVHRDLKPGNMLFHSDGRLLLADFGLAKVLHADEDPNAPPAALTSVGTIVGTPEYLSPEQASGKAVDYRTDVYSLGIVLYQMLAGRVPFTGSSAVAVALKHTLEMPPPITTFNPTVSKEVEAVMLKAVAKAPADRYASAGELAKALHLAAFGQLPATAPHTPITRSHPVPSLYTSPTPGAHVQHDALTEASTPVPSIGDGAASDHQMTLASSPSGEHHTPAPEGETMGVASVDLFPTYIQQTGEQKTPEKIAIPAAPTPVGGVASDTRQKDRPATKEQLPGASPVAAQAQQDAPPVQAKEPQKGRKQRSIQSVGMMLLGSILTLMLIVGAFFAYTTMVMKPTTQKTTTGSTPTQKAGGITQNNHPTPVASTTPANSPVVVLPGARIPAGKQLYGTLQPGAGCDTHGGQWSKSANATVQCRESGDVLLSNTGSQGIMAGTFINSLSQQGDTFPNDYVVQVEVTQQSAAQGSFGIYFRNQPGSDHQGSYAFIINPGSKTWTLYSYDDKTGAGTQLATAPLQVDLKKTVTIDVQVQGDAFNFYVDGKVQGNGIGNIYETGNVGLAVDGGTSVAYKNFELFAVS